MSLVSVVLPTRNRAGLLSRALHSVLAQTHREFEVIVVDDGSTDGTPDVVRRISDRRVRHVRHEQSAGAAAARNAGIRAARGDYLAFQDDDDVWLIERLEKQLLALQSAGDDVALSVCGHFCLEQNGPHYVGGARALKHLDFSRGMTGDWSLIATPGWLVRRQMLDRAGLFDEQIRVWHDWDLALRLSQLGRIVHLAEPLFIQDRIRSAGLVRDRLAIAADLKALIRKHGAAERWPVAIVFRHCLMRAWFELAARLEAGR